MADEVEFMRRALSLATIGLGLASPNPMVGAVLVTDGRVVGEGWHEGPGTQHAEAMALSHAGVRARGATLYVTLEPCSHHGRTPPCGDALIRAGVARVVAAARDPNPVVDGRGFEALREAGIRVDEGLLGSEAAELIAGFAKHVVRGLPFVTLKMAASLDGKVAARDGSSRWITGDAAREDVHWLRAASDAIMVGSATALADDPSLTVRLEGYRGRPPLRVLVDGSGRVPPTGALFDRSAPTMVATTAAAPEAVRDAWEAAGADVVQVDGAGSGDRASGPSRVGLTSLAEALGKRGAQSVLVEGGPTLAWAAVEAGIVDRLVLYLAATLIGGERAPGVLGGEGIRTITGALPVRIRSVDRIGDDVKVVADVHRDH